MRKQAKKLTNKLRPCLFSDGHLVKPLSVCCEYRWKEALNMMGIGANWKRGLRRHEPRLDEVMSQLRT